MTVQGLPGQSGLPGMPGEQGPIGPQGLPGPSGKSTCPSLSEQACELFSGHDGFTEQPIGFHAELKRLFIAKTHNRILRPWKLSDSFNLPNVSNYFSHETGIFTVPESGLYQFFLTIAVSHAQVQPSPQFYLNSFVFFSARRQYTSQKTVNLYVQFESNPSPQSQTKPLLGVGLVIQLIVSYSVKWMIKSLS